MSLVETSVTLWEKHKKYSETDIFEVIDVLIDVKHLLCLVAIFFNRLFTFQ